MISFTTDFHSFVTGGYAVFTAKSLKSGRHYTFKVEEPSKNSSFKDCLFVKVRTGEDYSGIGLINTSKNVFYPKKDLKEADSVKLFGWLWGKSDKDLREGQNIEIDHAGVCCRCGRELTNPDSIKSGIGPFCASKL